eukprot:GHVR01126834.1.p1 GENE.GHVR01126834.1~~GHVR01126834.1.p1  ORF type:complete len:444 (-),score=69.18 GHVR01126834.1:301-1632(-)
MFPRSNSQLWEYIDEYPRNDWGKEKITSLTGNSFITVTDPTIKETASFLLPYTTYLVSGRTHTGSEFSLRKRYSDFEWLQKTLRLCFPGLFVPPIPQKQRKGRFEDHFVQQRMQRLQEFLERVASRCYFAKSRVFVNWLISNESELVLLKRSFEKPAQVLLVDEFKDRMVDYINNDPQLNDSVSFFRSFLSAHQHTLDSLCKHAMFLGAENGTYLRTLSTILRNLDDLQENELNFLKEIDEYEQPCRLKLTEGLKEEIRTLNLNTLGHMDMLTSVFTRELEDTEAMLQAVRQFDRLSDHVLNLKIRLEEQNTLIESLRSGTWSIGKMLQSTHEQLSGAEDAAHRLKGEIVIGYDWFIAARSIMISKELPEFINNKINLFDEVILSMSGKRAGTLYKQMNIWREFMSKSITMIEAQGGCIPVLNLSVTPFNLDTIKADYDCYMD